MNTKKIKMLILYSDPILKERVYALFKKNKIKFIFSEAKKISETRKNIVEECDIYCIARKFIDGDQSISYCTIILENKDILKDKLCTSRFSE